MYEEHDNVTEVKMEERSAHLHNRYFVLYIKKGEESKGELCMLTSDR